MKTLHLGSFDAESFWRDPGLASLPALPDPSAGRIVAAMDELLFPACQPGDLLITRFPMQAAFAGYLKEIGFTFEHNPVALKQGSAPEPGDSIFDLLQKASSAVVCGLLDGIQRMNPYAILPGMEAFCRKYSLPYTGPSLEAVVKVNSKAYSHQLAVDLGLKDYGCLVGSAAELVEQGRRLLAGGPLLVKDPFGVSGKGNLPVSSPGMLERTAAHLAAQEAKGKRVSLVLEPFFSKGLDFSCQMRIEADGWVRFLSLQQMHNQQLAYQGSSRLPAEQAALFEKSGYFHQMEAVGACLFREGYWGEVCIDSMQLSDGRLVPVVEINARQSMGLMNHHLEQFLGPVGLPSHFTFLSVGVPGPLRFDRFLEELDRAGLLFTRKRMGGILPLSANTLTVNLVAEAEPASIGSQAGDDRRCSLEAPGYKPAGSSVGPPARPLPPRIPKGRFYFSILAPAEARLAWLEKVRRYFQDLGFKIYS